jgi:nucleoside-diphosphate-sugar epimerase
MTQPRRAARSASGGLTVAVTGPTGDIGRALLGALERDRGVKRVLGMARRPFDPAEFGWSKVRYTQGDVLDRGAVERLVKDADVVVHLAFIIIGGLEETREVNLIGSRNVFEAALGSRKVKRFVYTSSVAAYGFHEDASHLLVETDPPRGTERFYYSAQKSELEGLLSSLLDDSDVPAWIFRPCIVAGADAPLLIENMPYISLRQRLPSAVISLLETMPVLRPVLPDPGVPFQLVHADDVALALRAAVNGRGSPGVYNLAAAGELTLSDVARELGWYSIPLPEIAADAAAGLAARLPFLPPEARWLQAFSAPVLMDTAKARRELRWRPKYDATQVLHDTVEGARDAGLLR